MVFFLNIFAIRWDAIIKYFLIFMVLLILCRHGFTQVQGVENHETGVLIYGGTPAGIAAAIAAADGKTAVMLIEPTRRIGGMVTHGLSHTDFRSIEGLTGTFFQFTRRIAEYYKDKYGEDSPQFKQCFHGTHSEPKVNLLIFHEMLKESPTIRIQHQWILQSVSIDAKTNRIERCLFHDKNGLVHAVSATIFIDSSYEGDLMALAGVPYRYGREAREEYGESLAPEKADAQVQGYNFRLVMTTDPSNRVTPSKPNGYQRELFTGVLPLFEDRSIQGVFGYSPPVYIYKAQIPFLPNQKYDINDVSHSPVRLSLPDINDAYPDADAATRRAIVHEHLLWNVGLLYFLQNDAAVPEPFQSEARKWGWCRDEFVETGYIPEQLYIREARRMIGQYVFTENDTNYASGDSRTVLHKDAIAMGDYGLNCHGTGHEGSRFGVQHTGEFYKRVAPYQIPFGVFTPQEIPNLFVPVAVSASHVGFSALRFEPIWTSLGQAAGTAASLALHQRKSVQTISVGQLQAILHRNQAATIYISDILPGNPDFAMVQWWATAGGLHGLHPTPDTPGQRGNHLVGQYFEAFPYHEADLDRLMDKKTEEVWSRLALQLGFSEPDLLETKNHTTRREWLQSIWKRHLARSKNL